MKIPTSNKAKCTGNNIRVSMLFTGQAPSFDGHARGILSELEGVFQVFQDVTEIR